jgi:Arc/MetJ family transcription regulator
MKEMSFRTKVHTTEELLRRIMDAAYIRKHPEMVQRAVDSCLERARLYIENRDGHIEQL